jgi:phosphoglycolate phosphatase
MPRATIVFDLDGTLVDTAPDLAGAMNRVLAHFGRQELDVAAVRSIVGRGGRRTIERGLQLTGGVEPVMVDEGLPIFLAHYAENICVGTRVWDGVEAALDALSAHRLVLCTNKPERLTRLLLDALGWQDRFAAVVGGDTLVVRKPDPLHVSEAVARAGGELPRAAFVGDSDVDVAAARAAGIPVVITGFGYSETPAAELGADAVIAHFDELTDALCRVAPTIFGRGGAQA